MKELETIERAFPQVYEYTQEDGTKAKIVRYGMTLRDYFAAKAMQTMVEGRGAANLEQGGYVAVSMVAYKMADAMMKAREV